MSDTELYPADSVDEPVEAGEGAAEAEQVESAEDDGHEDSDAPQADDEV